MCTVWQKIPNVELNYMITVLQPFYGWTVWVISLPLLCIRQRQLNFLMYGPDQPWFWVNQNNNNTDVTYKHFFFLFIILLFWFFFLLDYNKIHKKLKFSAFDIVELRSKEMWLVSYVTCIDLMAQVSLTWWSAFYF